MERRTVNRQWSQLLGFTIFLGGFLSVRWLAVASPGELTQASRSTFLLSGVLTLLLLGLLLSFWMPGRQQDGPPGGGDDPLPPEPQGPDADPIEAELQRIIAEERSRVLPAPALR